MARHHGRELALKVLFEHDLANTDIAALIQRTNDGEIPDDQEFAKTLAEGTSSHLDEIDAMISKVAVDWKITRMPTIDRNILRLALFELLYLPQVPISVIINEGLELAHAYSTDDAKRFLNGVLSTLAKTVRPEGDTDRG